MREGNIIKKLIGILVLILLGMRVIRCELFDYKRFDFL